MTKIRKYFLVLGTLVMIAIILWAVFLGTGEPNQNESELEAGVEFGNVALAGIHEGVRQWELASGQLRQDNDLVYLDEISQLVLFRAGEPKYYVTADAGIWDRTTGLLELNGSVAVTDGQDFRLQAKKLIWDAEQEVLKFPGDTVILF